MQLIKFSEYIIKQHNGLDTGNPLCESGLDQFEHQDRYALLALGSKGFQVTVIKLEFIIVEMSADQTALILAFTGFQVGKAGQNILFLFRISSGHLANVIQAYQVDLFGDSQIFLQTPGSADSGIFSCIPIPPA